MTDRPIIFSGAMVRALLAGRKTQTRRLGSSPLARCAVGDRLYVREAAAVASIFSDVVEVRYQASARQGHTQFVEQVPVEHAAGAKVTWPAYRPSIHMPRWASRLTLTVTAVRQQPLHAMTEADAEAEGVERDTDRTGLAFYHVPGIQMERRAAAPEAFGLLWDSLHTAPGERWPDNPDVVALTFTVTAGNIDRISA